MRQNIVRLTCDICGDEVGEFAGLNENTKYFILELNFRSSDKEFAKKEICHSCNEKIMNLVFDIMSGKK